MARARTTSGRRLNDRWGVNARHALYHHEGLWYERLESFPGALFDERGYVVFETEADFLNCPALRITKKVWVPDGIAAIAGYRLGPGDSLASAAPIPTDHADAFEEGGVKYQLHRRKERNRRAVEAKKQSVLTRCGALVCEACDFEFTRAYGPLGTGFAECHHRTPLASLEESHRTRLRDLAIVCANCHRMLHKSRPMLSVEELRRLVQSQMQGTPNQELHLTRPARSVSGSS